MRRIQPLTRLGKAAGNKRTIYTLPGTHCHKYWTENHFNGFFSALSCEKNKTPFRSHYITADQIPLGYDETNLAFFNLRTRALKYN